MSDIDTLQQYYQDLLIFQYRQKTKARGTIEAFVGAVLADAIYTQTRDAFDLDTAIGKQLDFLGSLRGLKRYFFTLDLSKEFMSVPSYDDPGIGTYLGMVDYDDPIQPPSWFFMNYDDFTSHTLLDGDFRRIIKFVAKVHSCDHAYETIDNICFTFFGNNVNLVDLGGMAAKYQHLTTDPDVLFSIARQMGLLPSPAGVTITTEEVAAF